MIGSSETRAEIQCDVLVVGAGPAGSATAAALAAQGRDVLLVEARRHPRPKACAEYASPRIQEELRALGMSDPAWQAHAIALAGMRIVNGRESVDIRYSDGNPRTAWGLDRDAFDAALADLARERGARLLERAVLDDVLFGPADTERVTGAVIRTSEGRRVVACRWLIGADGVRSRVAARLGVARPVVAPRRLGLVARYEGVPDLADSGEMHVGPRGYVGLAPLPDGRLNVGMAIPMDGVRRSAAERFADTIESIPDVARLLRGSRRLTPIRGVAPIGHRVARAAGPGWMLVGDAAGFVDPFTGEGIYRALRSARAAAEALREEERADDVGRRSDGGEWAADGADRRYLAARRAAFTAKDVLTWTIQGMLAAQPLMRYAMRRLASRTGLALRLGSALGDCRPAAEALSPPFLFAVLRP